MKRQLIKSSILTVVLTFVFTSLVFAVITKTATSSLSPATSEAIKDLALGSQPAPTLGGIASSLLVLVKSSIKIDFSGVLYQILYALIGFILSLILRNKILGKWTPILIRFASESLTGGGRGGEKHAEVAKGLLKKIGILKFITPNFIRKIPLLKKLPITTTQEYIDTMIKAAVNALRDSRNGLGNEAKPPTA